MLLLIFVSEIIDIGDHLCNLDFHRKPLPTVSPWCLGYPLTQYTERQVI